VISELPELNSGFASCYPKFQNKFRVFRVRVRVFRVRVTSFLPSSTRRRSSTWPRSSHRCKTAVAGPSLLSARLVFPRFASFMAIGSSLWVVGGQIRQDHDRIRRSLCLIWCAPMEEVPRGLHGGLSGSAAATQLLGVPGF
jgi:hypothetical protein